MESFKLESSPIRVLVTGDVASEGVNLHSQCHHLVHYDIPWSLIRIEQRNGRIDRYGQRHRPEITTLLLTPSTERFGGDIRVLTKLVEREHEAHTALGDSASLIGTYDVKAEEEAIREVLAGNKQLDNVVKTVEQVGTGGGLDALFADLATGQITQDVPEPVGSTPDQSGTGVYSTEFAFLSDALTEFIKTPEKAPPNGVSWTVHKRQSIAALTPPRDLAQRLEVLPQSYLRDRKVIETFKLAYTTLRGEEELRQARPGSRPPPGRKRTIWRRCTRSSTGRPTDHSPNWAATRSSRSAGTSPSRPCWCRSRTPTCAARWLPRPTTPSPSPTPPHRPGLPGRTRVHRMPWQRWPYR